MGTGSFGGGSSGALGRGGSGARFSYGGWTDSATGSSMATFFGNRGGDGPRPGLDAARDLVRDTFAQRGVSEYLYKMISSTAVQGMFEELFTLSVLLLQGRDWTAIIKRYGVSDQAGCLAELAAKIKTLHGEKEALEAFREVAGGALDDVLLAAIGDNDDLYLDGNASELLSAIEKYGAKIFASLSGYYFGSVLNRAAVREIPPLSDEEKLMIERATQERADFIIDRFRYTHMGKNQTTYRQMLQIFEKNEEWFCDKLRERIQV